MKNHTINILIFICIGLILFSIIQLIKCKQQGIQEKQGENWSFLPDSARVNGVTINNSKQNVITSGIESGMFLPQVQQLLNKTGSQDQSGKANFDLEDAAIKNTLELSHNLTDFVCEYFVSSGKRA